MCFCLQECLVQDAAVMVVCLPVLEYDVASICDIHDATMR